MYETKKAIIDRLYTNRLPAVVFMRKTHYALKVTTVHVWSKPHRITLGENEAHCEGAECLRWHWHVRTGNSIFWRNLGCNRRWVEMLLYDIWWRWRPNTGKGQVLTEDVMHPPPPNHCLWIWQWRQLLSQPTLKWQLFLWTNVTV